MVNDPRAMILRIIHQRYSVEQLIGQGGMGCVYLATDKQTGAPCAIKMFMPISVSERYADTYRRFLERFKRESRIMQSANHPHIIRFIDTGEVQDEHKRDIAFFVMPYYANGSLSDLIEQMKQIPLADACRYIRQAASAKGICFIC